MKTARMAGVKTVHLSAVTHPDPDQLDEAMLNTLVRHQADLVVTAGFLKKVGSRVLERYANHIINIHPSLLPKHGGPGMFGQRVHAAVLAAGDKETGATVHRLTANYDEGAILAQVRMDVTETDSPESLSARLLPLEHELLVTTIAALANADSDPAVV